MDIYSLDPRHFQFLHFLSSRMYGERSLVTPEMIMERLRLTRPTVYRTLSEMEAEGLISRPSRGRINLLITDFGTPVVRPEVSKMRLRESVDKSSSTSHNNVVESADALSPPLRAPREGETVKMKRITVIEDDELQVHGDLVPMPKPKKRSAKGSMYHRQTAREEWTMTHVVMEFRLQLYKARPDLLPKSDRGRFVTALHTIAKRSPNVTPKLVADAIEPFFTEFGPTLSSETVPWKKFLSYLQRRSDFLFEDDDMSQYERVEQW